MLIKYKARHSILIRAIAMVVVCLFVFNDIAFGLAPASRLNTGDFQKDSTVAALDILMKTFVNDLSRKVQLGVSARGIRKDLEKLKRGQLQEFIASIKQKLSHVNLDEYLFDRMYLDGNAICLPCIGKDGQMQIRRYNLTDKNQKNPGIETAVTPPGIEQKDIIVKLTDITPKAKIVVLDWDGTVVNTVPFILEAWSILYPRIMEGKGVDWMPKTEEEKRPGIKFFHSISGKSLYDIMEYLVAEAKKKGIKNLQTTEYYSREFTRIVIEGVKKQPKGKILIQETVEFLRELRKRGLKGKIIQTSGMPPYVLKELIQYLGLEYLFDEVHGAYPPEEADKPHNKAELIAMLKKEHNLTGEEIVMIGDGISDVKEGKEGGAIAVALVPDSIDEERFKKSGADILIRSKGIDKGIINHLGIELENSISDQTGPWAKVEVVREKLPPPDKSVIAVFDVHGTLLKPNRKEIYCGVYKKLNGGYPSEQWIKDYIYSKSEKEIIGSLSQIFNRTKAEVEKLRTEIRTQMWSDAPPKLIPGALEFIKALNSRGVRIIIHSGALRDEIIGQLERAGLLKYIKAENIICRRPEDGDKFDKADAIKLIHTDNPSHTIAYFDDWTKAIEKIKDFVICFGIPQSQEANLKENRQQLIKSGAHYILQGGYDWQTLDKLLTTPAQARSDFSVQRRFVPGRNFHGPFKHHPDDMDVMTDPLHASGYIGWQQGLSHMGFFLDGSEVEKFNYEDEDIPELPKENGRSRSRKKPESISEIIIDNAVIDVFEISQALEAWEEEGWMPLPESDDLGFVIARIKDSIRVLEEYVSSKDRQNDNRWSPSVCADEAVKARELLDQLQKIDPEEWGRWLNVKVPGSETPPTAIKPPVEEKKEVPVEIKIEPPPVLELPKREDPVVGSPDINTPYIVGEILRKNPKSSLDDVLKVIAERFGVSSINDLKAYPNLKDEVKGYLAKRKNSTGVPLMREGTKKLRSWAKRRTGQKVNYTLKQLGKKYELTRERVRQVLHPFNIKTKGRQISDTKKVTPTGLIYWKNKEYCLGTELAGKKVTLKPSEGRIRLRVFYGKKEIARYNEAKDIFEMTSKTRTVLHFGQISWRNRRYYLGPHLAGKKVTLKPFDGEGWDSGFRAFDGETEIAYYDQEKDQFVRHKLIGENISVDRQTGKENPPAQNEIASEKMGQSPLGTVPIFPRNDVELDPEREKNIAIDFVDELIPWVIAAQEKRQFVVLGLDESWMPNQANAPQKFIEAIEELIKQLKKKGLENIIFIKGKGDFVATEILQVVSAKKELIPLSNIIVLGSRDILKQDSSNKFNQLRRVKPEESALLIGVNPENLKMDSAIMLPEMFLLAMRLASGVALETLDQSFIKIAQSPDGRARAFIFTPIKPFDIDKFGDAMKLQIREIENKA